MKEMFRFTFNTGRRYSEEGQVITVSLREDGSALFHDHSRGVAGRLSHPASAALSHTCTAQAILRRDLMFEYDRNHYLDDSEGWSLTRDR